MRCLLSIIDDGNYLFKHSKCSYISNDRDKPYDSFYQ